MPITCNDIKNHEAVRAFMKKGNENLGVLGFTDHSEAHSALVADRAGRILQRFGYSEKEQELARIAGFMHDIGNAINRKNHAEYGAFLADDILRGTDISLEDRITVISAISHHDESTGGATDIVSAALIIADKTDVRRNRVRRTKARSAFDIHDRVNYAVTKNHMHIDEDARLIALELEVDESICTMYEYFDIFLDRMLMSRSSAEMLQAKFSLVVNGNRIL